jgi:hypothetical protein
VAFGSQEVRCGVAAVTKYRITITCRESHGGLQIVEYAAMNGFSDLQNHVEYMMQHGVWVRHGTGHRLVSPAHIDFIDVQSTHENV